MTESTVPDTTIHEPSMTAGEVDMLLFALERSRATLAWKCGGLDADPNWEWHSAADDSPSELYGLWRAAVERSRAAWARLLEEGGLDQPSKFVMRNGESPNLRRVLVDSHDEYARHVGHADLLREAIDGLVGEDPPQP